MYSFFVFCKRSTTTICKSRLSSINLFPADKNLFTISFIFYRALLNKHLLVFKTCLHLQHNNILSFKTSWRWLGRQKFVMLKTSSRRLKDISWRSLEDMSWNVLKTYSKRLGDKKNVSWGYLYLTNLNMYLTNLYFTNVYLTNLRPIQKAFIRTQKFRYLSYFETQAAFLFWELKFLKLVT